MRFPITIGLLLALGLAHAGAQVPSAPRTTERITLTSRAVGTPRPTNGAKVQVSPRVIHSLARTGGASRTAAERSLSAPTAERRRTLRAQLRASRSPVGNVARRP